MIQSLPDLRSGPWSSLREVRARNEPLPEPRSGPRSQRRRARKAARTRRRWTRAGNAVLVLVLMVLALALGAMTVPRLMGYEQLIVRSGSMGDAYPTGSMVGAELMPAGEVAVGDVVLARPRGEQGEPVMHRVIEVWREDGEPVVRTKGDANQHADPQPYELPTKVPVARYHLPWIGYLVAFGTTPFGWFLVLILPAALLTASVLVQVWSPPYLRLRWTHDVALAS